MAAPRAVSATPIDLSIRTGCCHLVWHSLEVRDAIVAGCETLSFTTLEQSEHGRPRLDSWTTSSWSSAQSVCRGLNRSTGATNPPAVN